MLQLITRLFQYWCKQKTSKYLRVDVFYKNMIIFGLAPNETFLK